jgi:hypothetical protein
MTIEEVIKIKEKMSLETAGMSVNELHAYYSTGAAKIQKMIDLQRTGNRQIRAISYIQPSAASN